MTTGDAIDGATFDSIDGDICGGVDVATDNATDDVTYTAALIATCDVIEDVAIATTCDVICDFIDNLRLRA